MQPKPIFIGVAAGILILVVAAASFFAGLYVGQRGYVAALQSQPGVQPQNVPGQLPQNGPYAGNPLPSGPGAGQPLQNGSSPAGGPPGAPSWPPDIMARFVSRTADSISVEGPQRQFTIRIDSSTRYTDELGNPIDPSILQAGDTLAIFGRDMATLIIRLPSRPNAP